jgi:hypothetical protein
MRKIALLILVSLLLADVKCPCHPGAYCWDTGMVVPQTQAKIYRCSCGDKVYVAQ